MYKDLYYFLYKYAMSVLFDFVKSCEDKPRHTHSDFFFIGAHKEKRCWIHIRLMLSFYTVQLAKKEYYKLL